MLPNKNQPYAPPHLISLVQYRTLIVSRIIRFNHHIQFTNMEFLPYPQNIIFAVLNQRIHKYEGSSTGNLNSASGKIIPREPSQILSFGNQILPGIFMRIGIAFFRIKGNIRCRIALRIAGNRKGNHLAGKRESSIFFHKTNKPKYAFVHSVIQPLNNPAALIPLRKAPP